MEAWPTVTLNLPSYWRPVEFPVVSSLPFVLFGCAPPSIRPIFVADPFVARERDAQHLLGPHARPCRKGVCWCIKMMQLMAGTKENVSQYSWWNCGWVKETKVGTLRGSNGFLSGCYSTYDVSVPQLAQTIKHDASITFHVGHVFKVRGSSLLKIAMTKCNIGRQLNPHPIEEHAARCLGSSLQWWGYCNIAFNNHKTYSLTTGRSNIESLFKRVHVVQDPKIWPTPNHSSILEQVSSGCKCLKLPFYLGTSLWHLTCDITRFTQGM